MSLTSIYDDFKEEVRTHNDIVGVVSRYVKLKKTGTRHWGICPFHREKSPSFTVRSDSGVYHCFGCGASGDVFKFVMQMEHTEFPEALRILADWAGLRMPENAWEGQQREDQRQKRDRLFALNAEAAKYFYRTLHLPECVEAQKYLHQRCLSKETIRKFGIGYAPDGWEKLYAHLLQLGYTEQEMLEVGLIVHNTESGKVYDRFRNRIMFPIFDLKKNVIGFGGRILGKGEPKYLNSPESVVFVKSRNLFALHLAKGNAELIVTEGYMDVISLHQHGISNAVATLGTALNADHARVLKQYAKAVVLCYDTDQAGQTATKRGIDVLMSYELEVRILQLSVGKDPDEYIGKMGVDRFRQEVKMALPWAEYLLDDLKKTHDLEDERGKLQYANASTHILHKVKNAIDQDALVRKVAALTGVSSQALLKQAGDMDVPQRDTRYRPMTRTAQTTGANKKEMTISRRQLMAERLLLLLMCNEKALFHSVIGRFPKEQFGLDNHQKLCGLLEDLHKKGEAVSMPRLLLEFAEEEQTEITAIFQSEAQFEDSEKAISDLLKTIEQEKNLFEYQKNIAEGNVEKLKGLQQKFKNPT